MVLNSKSGFSLFLVSEKAISCNSPFHPAGGSKVRRGTDLRLQRYFSSTLTDQTQRFSAHSTAERCVLSLHFNVAKHLLKVSIIKVKLCFIFLVQFNSKALWSLGKSGASQNRSHLSKYLKSDSQIELALPGKQHNYIPKMPLSLIKIKCCVVIYKVGLSN